MVGKKERAEWWARRGRCSGQEEEHTVVGKKRSAQEWTRREGQCSGQEEGVEQLHHYTVNNFS
jgi:hypothetical protein